MNIHSRISVRASRTLVLALATALALVGPAPAATAAPSTAPALTDPIADTSTRSDVSNFEATGLVAGAVSDPDGIPLPGILVSVYAGDPLADPFGDELTLFATVTTDSDGYWTLAVPAGSYAVFFDPIDDLRYAWSWSSGRATPFGSFVDVVAGESTPVDMEMRSAAELVGEVRVAPTLRGSNFAQVILWAGAQEGGQGAFSPVVTTTPSDGLWRVGQLPPGSYLVEIASPTPAVRGEWYDEATSFESASLLVIGPGVTNLGDVVLDSYAQVLPAQLSIHGTVAIGQRVSTSIPARAAGVTHTVKWFADGEYISGSLNKTAITLGESQGGKRITVRVAATRDGFLTTRSASVESTRTSRFAVPTISGTRGVDRTLTAVEGRWSVGTTFTYQWYADGRPVTGATDRTFRPTLAHEGARIQVRVGGKKPGYTTVAPLSPATSRLPRIGVPFVSGVPRVGQLTMAHMPIWMDSETRLTWVWLADGRVISGNIGPLIYPTNAMRGKKLTVKVTATRPGYASYTTSSVPSAAVR